MGSPCPGPVQTLRWSSKHEIFQPERQNAAVQELGPTPPTRSNDATATVPASLPSGSETETAAHEIPLFEHPSLAEHGAALNEEYGQPIEGFDLGDTDWGDQLFENLFPDSVDMLGDTLAPKASMIDTPNRELFETYGTLSPAAELSPSFVGTGSRTPASPAMEIWHQAGRLRRRHGKPLATRKADHRSYHLFPPLRRSPRDNATVLVEFYFRGAAQAYSVYDGDMNPFRSTVSKLWGSSQVIYLSLQSMAAAYLAETYPSLAPLGKKLRQEALDALACQESEGKFDDKALLALLMVGGTSSWHDTGDMGVPLLNLFRKHVQRMRGLGQLMKNGNSLRFFQESLLYWEMLLAYVVDDDQLGKSESTAVDTPILTPADGATNVQPSDGRHVPHPWTGIARDTQVLVQEVGRLVRSHRLRAHKRSFATQAAVSQLQHEIMRASQLEAALLDLSFPEEANVTNPDDCQTPVWHLLSLAEGYRRAALMQLYRVFPDILVSRLESEYNDSSTSEPSESNFTGCEGAREGTELELSSAMCDEWLTDFALRTIDLLAPILVESGTRDFQPFILVACSSELRYHKKAPHQEGDESTYFSEMPLSMQGVEVSRARGLVLSRLQAFLHCLPPKPIRRCIEIVQATWETMDKQTRTLNGKQIEEPVYWMDVMIERGWETTMG